MGREQWENHSRQFIHYIQVPTVLLARMHARQKPLGKNKSFLSSLSIVLSAIPWSYAASCTLCFEGERGADLVGGLVELLGIEGGAEAEGDAGTKEDVVGDGCDTAVVDLELGE